LYACTSACFITETTESISIILDVGRLDTNLLSEFYVIRASQESETSVLSVTLLIVKIIDATTYRIDPVKSLKFVLNSFRSYKY
jgi:hypothetical protein